MTFKQGVRAVFERTGLIGPYFRFVEWRKGFGQEKPPATDEHGMPLPSAQLMARVVAYSDWRAFLKTGAVSAETLNEYANEGGVGFRDAERILDFGCGCGRIIRHLPQMTDGALFGVDYNPSLVRWCADNLTGAFTQNKLTPPLDFPDGHFDIVYLISVFTHLRLPTQREWLNELRRVTRPGGVAIITFHDEEQPGLPQSAKALAALKDEGVYIHNDFKEGSNLIATFQTRAFTAQFFAEAFDVVRIIPQSESPLGQAAAILRAK